MKARDGLALCAAVGLLGACGGASNMGSGTSCPSSAAVDIGPGGVSSHAVCVLVPGSVTFTNKDTVSHVLAWGTGCPQVPATLTLAASGTAPVTFSSAAVCPFDVDGQTTAAFQGTVTAVVPGTPGY